MDRGAWQATVHGVSESDMTERLTDRYEVISCFRVDLHFPLMPSDIEYFFM